jgi:hypothetical protein
MRQNDCPMVDLPCNMQAEARARDRKAVTRRVVMRRATSHLQRREKKLRKAFT